MGISFVSHLHLPATVKFEQSNVNIMSNDIFAGVNSIYTH